MKKLTARNFYLYLAILIPILMIAITTFNLIFYKVELHPQYSFIYMINDRSNAYTCWQAFKADLFPDHAIKSPSSFATNPPYSCKTAKLYEYDFASKKSTLVSIQQVKKMKLSTPSTIVSPDGFTINNYCYASDISSWGFTTYSYDSVCVKKGKANQRLDINYNQEYPDNYFYFVGWVLNRAAS